MSLCKHNFHTETEAVINKQINMELTASYVYLQMASFFERDRVSLPGLSKFFYKSSDEEKEHAKKLIEYQSIRGGDVVFTPITELIDVLDFTAYDALKMALDLEMKVCNHLLKLHSTGDKHNDPQLCDFIESEFLEEQVKAQKEIADMIKSLERCGKEGVGLYLFDKNLNV